MALEALGPRQRAVLLLRDVLGHSGAETAALLETSEGNVRVIHTRARHAMRDYDRERTPFDEALRARHEEALGRFLHCLVSQDGPALEALLSESVRTTTDAGGEFTALAAPMSGRARVSRFYLRAALHRREGEPRFEIRSVNGLPALLVDLTRPVRRQAPRSLLFVELDAASRIRAIQTLLAPRKLARIRFPSTAA
jgi:RNA polymerase sigma-70 factor (ECF subfamily)